MGFRPSDTRAPRLSVRAALLLALLVAFPTATTGCGACPAALLAGSLIAQNSELAIKEDIGGFVRPVRWPFGYSVHADRDGLVVTDVVGNLKAREGDHVRLPGGEVSNDGPWGVCGELEVS